MNILKNAFNTNAILSGGAAAIYPVSLWTAPPGNMEAFALLVPASPVFCAALLVSGLFSAASKERSGISRAFAGSAAAISAAGLYALPALNWDYSAGLIAAWAVLASGGFNLVSELTKTRKSKPIVAGL